MQLTVEDLPNGVTKAVLNGRMDIDGANAVDMKFSTLAASKKKLVVDLSGVSFLASMGLRTLMVTARTISTKGGKMALSNPQPNVAKVLSTTGANEIMPVAPSLDAAIAAVA